MRLIFSRKGFDSANGGVPSPILPDGTLRPLPIPYTKDGKKGTRTFADLGGPEPTVAKLLADLAPGRLRASTPVHLDPDLDRRTLPRPADWRPAFGQTDAAQSHLAKQHVGPGDLFLFFGWSRQVEKTLGSWHYVKSADHLHVIFGWLQVGEVLPARPDRKEFAPEWLHAHEHFRADLGPTSTVYVAADALTLGGTALTGVPGGGIVRDFRDALVLTAPDAPRSTWRLPKCLTRASGRPPLTYHKDRTRRQDDGPDHVRLRSAPIGQEFVTEYDEATLAWLRTLLAPEARA